MKYYKMIWINDKKKCMRLHRYIMECYLGRELTFNEIVHHKDENIHNNNLSNLELITRSEHIKKHNVANINRIKFDIKKEDILKMYKIENKSCKEIALFYGCDVHRIYQKMKEYNIIPDYRK